MYKGIIYKHTAPNQKSYIGQTTTSLAKRVQRGEGYRKQPVFYNAILKFGWDSFKTEILVSFEEEDLDELISKLNESEQYYISYYNTIVPNGYNVQLGGENHMHPEDSKCLKRGSEHFNWNNEIDDALLIEGYKKGKTIKQLHEETGIALATIKRHLVNSGIYKEKRYNAAVVKYDKNWNIVGEWPSITAAEKAENTHGIGKTCRNKTRFYKGFTYRFKDEEV